MHTNNQHPQQQHGRSCPCKRVPLLLSSFTAAEHGNVPALLRRQGRPHQQLNSNSTASNQRVDSAGNTPLHLAAQHGHTGVTALLLRNNNNYNNSKTTVNAAAGGATPLHRASFSGAVATMRLLLEVPGCDLLARDTSFGDLQTPLHKACAGGRYLAVQLLLEALAARVLLEPALQLRDAAGQTPLQVAQAKLENAEQERRNVVRWDSVAGGVADWEMCVQLLEQFDAAITTTTTADSQEPRALPRHLQLKSQQQEEYCGCEQEGGQCRTASWERAFQAALQTTVNQNIHHSPKNSIGRETNEQNIVAGKVNKSNNTNNPKALQEKPPDKIGTTEPTITHQQSQQSTPTTPRGRQCADCGQPSIVLYPCSSSDDDKSRLVCKACRRCRPSKKTKNEFMN